MPCARLPHLGKGRMIRPGQMIHASVAFKPPSYRPKATLSGGLGHLQWNDLIATAKIGDLRLSDNWQGNLEMDLFDHSTAAGMFKVLENGDPSRTTELLDRLTILAWSSTYLLQVSALADDKP
jgi:hypothetical protein